ncbi:MAG: VWA domain-containing protein [Gemmataceae bacterium]
MATRSAPVRRPAGKGLLFPLGLGLLVVLALPGAVLLVLSLAGLEAPTNDWLREHLALSYHNPLPLGATLLLLLVPVVLVLLYFLKLRRQAVEVPSTFLWRRSIEDLHVNSLFQWLRDNLLLLAQLACALLLVYAALALQFHGRASVGGRHYIILLDNSASMNTTDVAPSRLEAARQQALALVEARPEGDAGMVIEFNARASILQPYTRDRGALRAALRQIQPTQRPTRIDDALTLADSLANPHRSADDEAVRPAGENPAEARTYVAPEGIAAEVHLFSDGRFPEVPGFAAGNLGLIYHRIGAPGPEMVNNVGIASFNAVRDEKDPARMQVFLRLQNFRATPAQVTVELETRRPGQAEFNLRETPARIDARMVAPGDPQRKVPPRDAPGEQAVTFQLDDIEEGADVLLHARLKNHQDQFAADDEAWLVAGVVRKARVLIVTPGNEVLRHFFDLEETARVARVTYLAPPDLADAAKYLQPARAGAFDLVVFDRCTPSTEDALPVANTFFIGEVPPPWKRAALPALVGAPIGNPASAHPLMRHLTGLDEIAYTEAFRFDLRAKGVPSGVPRLLEAGRETALLFLLPRRSFRDLVLTFPLVNAKGEWTTNWCLKASFPLFLRNVLYQLGNVSDQAAEETTLPGESRVLRPDGPAERVEVTDPAGMTQRVGRGAGAEFVYLNTERLGVYQATWPGGRRFFAVGLVETDEGNTQPRDEIKLGDQRIEADRERVQAYDTWKWMALGALLLLVVEWAVYHRRLWLGR